MSEKFEIIINIPIPQPFTFLVECFYASNQVRKYRVYNPKGYVLLSCHLNQKSAWKIDGANYDGFQAVHFVPYLKQVTRQIELFEAPIVEKQEHWKNNYNGTT